jgi:hypothetical protein
MATGNPEDPNLQSQGGAEYRADYGYLGTGHVVRGSTRGPKDYHEACHSVKQCSLLAA